jgi:hypothetical protein
VSVEIFVEDAASGALAHVCISNDSRVGLTVFARAQRTPECRKTP